MLSYTEENYLKALFKLTREIDETEVGTNALASSLGVKPASVNDMLKKLKEKKLIDYKKYGKIRLTGNGAKAGVEVLRKHRLWETFLHQKLGFDWTEVHEVAEQLEHIQSPKLVEMLDKFLGYPSFDPHGDVIPTAQGEIAIKYQTTIADMKPGQSARMLAVKDNESEFLKYVIEVGLGIGNTLSLIRYNAYDGLFSIEVNKQEKQVGKKFADNIYVEIY